VLVFRSLAREHCRLENICQGKRLFKHLIDMLPEMIWMSGKDRNIEFFNKAWLEFTGRTLAEEAGQGWMSQVRWQDRQNLWDSYSEAFDERKSFQFEYQHQRFDGQFRWVLLKGRPSFNLRGDFECYLGTVCDITEQRVLQSQLRQAQKMEVLGQMAGGVAHDFNNLLMVINGYSQWLLKKMATTDDLATQNAVYEILKAGERAADLTRRLLNFSSKREFNPQLVDLNSVVKNFEKMLRRLIPQNINLTLLMEATNPIVLADPGLLEQVILNLVVNSRDAMPEGGLVIIKTENLGVEKNAYAPAPQLVPGNYISMSVADTGCGIEETIKEQIFEPFFTTKESGKGTGLGLATVYNVIKQLGGIVQVDSRVGVGTNFTIYLPYAGDSLSPNRLQIKEEKTLGNIFSTI
jgi:PAS domain S-box-containing protein